MGVIGDDDREVAKTVNVSERMTWRSWWNGVKTGSIVSKWGVLSWLTVYITDAKGVIRCENVRSAMMDRAIDRLINDAQ